MALLVRWPLCRLNRHLGYLLDHSFAALHIIVYFQRLLLEDVLPVRFQ